DPAGVDVLEAVIVGGAGEVAEVGAGDGGERGAVLAAGGRGSEAAGELLGEVGGVAGRAAVAADQDLAPGGEPLGEEGPDGLAGAEGGLVGEEGPEGPRGVAEGLGEHGSQV